MPAFCDDPMDRYLPNTMQMKTLDASPKVFFKASLEKIVSDFPPRDELTEDELWGLAGGYTGLSHLFLQLSELHPEVHVRGESLRWWAQRYLKTERGPVSRPLMPICGLLSEDMSYKAMCACLSGRDEDVDLFLLDFVVVGAPVAEGEEDEYDAEMMRGRAGALYLLRLVRHWVPSCSERINVYIDAVAERLLESNGHGERSWSWMGKKYVGAAHGDIGNITQLVLCKPSLAERLENLLARLLALQLDDGGWPMYSNREDETDASALVQFCHGAPGVILGLRALYPHFPSLREAMDKAIAKAQSDCVWEKGLLVKEPSLCHGILGNALALPLGPKRSHFLANATSNAVARGKKQGLFEDSHYDWHCSVQMVYDLGAVWTWAVCEMEHPPMVMFTDV